MKLYFRPFSCSLAARIAIEEADIEAEFVPVDMQNRLPDGSDFNAINPMGYVPVIETARGFVLAETPAVLTYLAELTPEKSISFNAFSDEHYHTLAWLSFLSTEVHKAIFMPLFRGKLSEDQAATLRLCVAKPFARLSNQLKDRPFLEGRFTVADALLVTILNWCETAGIAIEQWPVLLEWRAQTRQRPSVMRAMAAEAPLFRRAA